MSPLEIYIVVGIRALEVLAIAGAIYALLGERIARWLGIDMGDQDQ